MATLELYYESSTDGSWPLRDTYELEEFISKYNNGMWPDERDIVRGLEVGDSYESGVGATPAWKVTRTR